MPDPNTVTATNGQKLTNLSSTPQRPGKRSAKSVERRLEDKLECQAERRSAVIAAAVHKIATLGLEGLRVRDVASESGINHATLLYYFPTKEDLIQAVVSNITARFDQFRAQASIAFSGKAAAPVNSLVQAVGPMGALRAYFADVCRFMRNDPAAFIVLNELLLRALRDPMVRRTLEAYESTWRAALARVLEAGVADGSFRPNLNISDTTTLIVVFLRGINLEVDETPDWIEHAVGVFADGLEVIIRASP